MRRKSYILGYGLIALSCVAIAVIAAPNWLRGNDSRPVPATGKLVMHEWGTFTSFAGSDGASLEFRPLTANDLPRFVMRPQAQPGDPWWGLGKEHYVALQRMETPVAYFYTDAPRVVNVRVDFPQGMLSEWYPVVKKLESGAKTDQRPMGGAYLDWGAVRLTPAAQFAQLKVRHPKGHAIGAALPPVGARHHYGRARETDSAVVETVDANGGSHFEKFLFYRGLGNFELPIKLVALGKDRFEVVNAGELATGALLLARIQGDSLRFTRLDPIEGRSAAEVELPADESSVEELAAATIAELTAAGLYDKEALAMVNTWRDSWFGEQGTRLLYLLPEEATERLLPLSIVPAPDEKVRVLVGRLETITPEDCQRLTRALVRAATADPSEASISAALAPLGRFAEPALAFVIDQTSDRDVRARLEAILAKLRPQG